MHIIPKLDRALLLLYLTLVAASAGNPQLAALSYVKNLPNNSHHTLPQSNPQPLTFNKTWGGPKGDVAKAIAVDSQGNIYMAGYTYSFLANSTSPYPDVLLLKYDSQGNLLWAKTWGGNFTDEALSITVDPSNNIYLTGNTNSFTANNTQAVLLLKFYPNGTNAWAKTWGGTANDQGYGITADSAGNIYVTGHTFSFGYDNSLFLLKLNPSGLPTCQRTFAGSAFGKAIRAEGNALIVDPAGNVYVSGTAASLTGPSQQHIFLAKFTPSCEPLWSETWSGNSSEVATGVAFDRMSGNIYVTGWTNSFGLNNRAVLLKFNATGTLLWERVWGGIGPDYARGLTVDAGENVYVTGETYSFGRGGDIFLLEFSGAGTILSQTYLGGANLDSGNAMTLGPAGNPLLAGFVSEGPPYAQGNAEGNLLIIVNATIAPLSFLPVDRFESLVSRNGAITSPIGSQTYAGAEDTFLYGFIAITCTNPTANPTSGPAPLTVSFQVSCMGGTPPYNYYWDFQDGNVSTLRNPNNTYVVVGTYQPAVTVKDSAGIAYVFKTPTITVSGPPSIPSAPLKLRANAGYERVALTWDPPASNGGKSITNYKIYRGTSPNNENPTPLYMTGNVTSYLDTQVTPNLQYCYKVSAVNSLGESAKSVEACATPQLLPTAPSAPQNLTATAGDRQIVLRWDSPTDNGRSPITGYKIYRANSSSGFGANPYLAVGNITFYYDSGVNVGTTYYYEVTAVNNYGESAYSVQASAPAISTPSSPSNLRANASTGKIILTWTSPEYNGYSAITGYKVYRGTSPGGESGAPSAILGNVTSYNDPTAAPGVTYFYIVKAVNQAGEGAPSNEANAQLAPGITIPLLIGIGAILIASVPVYRYVSGRRRSPTLESTKRESVADSAGLA